jgi:peptide subunit release factor 1 (eRF1)
VNIDTAAGICIAVAAESKRWGKHAGFAGFHEDQVRDALICCHAEGLFSMVEEKKERIKANKNAGAAKARASKAQKEVERLREIVARQQDVIDMQRKRLEKFEK